MRTMIAAHRAANDEYFVAVLTDIDAHDVLLGAVHLEQVLHPEDVVEPLRYPRHQRVRREAHVQVEVLLEEDGCEAAHRVSVREVEADLKTRLLTWK